MNTPSATRRVLVMVALPILVLACGKAELEGWSKWQAGYEQVLAGHLHEEVQIARGIKEVATVWEGKSDRCVTCHLGVQEPRLKDAFVQNPYRFHPSIPHPTSEFGCTVCHRGDGQATTKEEAHGGVPPRSDPMLPLVYVEGSCGQCHQARVVPEAPDITEGRQLIEKLGCTGCHEIPGFEDTRKNAFDLNGLGSKVTRPWLIAWLQNPRGWSPISTMPVYYFSSKEIDQLADFLMSSKNERFSRVARKIERANGSASHASVDRRGHEIIQSLKCISCHSFGGKGGRLAQDLEWIGSKVKRDWLFAWLKFPAKYFPATRMPRYSFPDEDIHALAEHLAGSFKAPQGKLPEAMELKSMDPASVAAGRKLFGDSRCVGCHDLEGIKRPIRLGPSLASVGSRKLEDLDFGNADVERTVAAWLRANVKEPHVLNPNLRMPDFQLSDLETDRITTALIGLTDRQPPPSLAAPPQPAQEKAQPTGLAKELFDRYQCLDCHMLGGKGEPLAMDLGLTGSKLRRAWLVDYLKKPYPIRPLVKERMPPFGMSDAEIEALADYFTTACAESSLEGDPFAGRPIPDKLIERGRDLYYNEYGCQACHILGDGGGVYGPSLNGAGDRLRPGWIQAWIMDPRALDPNTRKPKYGISDENARALTAFISSQHQADVRDLPVEADRHLIVPQTPIPSWLKSGARYEAQRGRDVYTKYCAFCHGERGAGDGPSVDRLEVAPTNFTTLEVMAPLTRKNLIAAIKGGGRGVGKSNLMPPYRQTLSDNQIEAVVTYIRTFIPMMARLHYYKQRLAGTGVDDSTTLLRTVTEDMAWLENFFGDAPSELRSGLDPLEAELQALTEALSKTKRARQAGEATEASLDMEKLSVRIRLLSDRVERFREAQQSALRSLVEREDLQALNKALEAGGHEQLAPPGLSASYRETVDSFRAFNAAVEQRGSELFGAQPGSVTWEVWKFVYAGLTSGVFDEQHRPYLAELEDRGLVKMTVELR